VRHHAGMVHCASNPDRNLISIW